MNKAERHNIGNNSPLESAITAALEQQQTPMIPADFASRVATRAAALPRRSRTPRAVYARSVSLALSAALLIALFILAPHAQPSFSSVSFDIELLAVMVLGALLYGLAQMRNEQV